MATVSNGYLTQRCWHCLTPPPHSTLFCTAGSLNLSLYKSCPTEVTGHCPPNKVVMVHHVEHCTPNRHVKNASRTVVHLPHRQDKFEMGSRRTILVAMVSLAVLCPVKITLGNEGPAINCNKDHHFTSLNLSIHCFTNTVYSFGPVLISVLDFCLKYPCTDKHYSDPDTSKNMLQDLSQLNSGQFKIQYSDDSLQAFAVNASQITAQEVASMAKAILTESWRNQFQQVVPSSRRTACAGVVVWPASAQWSRRTSCRRDPCHPCLGCYCLGKRQSWTWPCRDQSAGIHQSYDWKWWSLEHKDSRSERMIKKTTLTI